MERKLYIVSNYDAGTEKVVKLTDEQARAIEWFIDGLEISYYNIELADEAEDIDEP